MTVHYETLTAEQQNSVIQSNIQNLEAEHFNRSVQIELAEIGKQVEQADALKAEQVLTEAKLKALKAKSTKEKGTS